MPEVRVSILQGAAYGICLLKTTGIDCSSLFMHKSCDAIGIMNPFTNMKAAAATTVGDISELSLLSAADSHLHKHATQPGARVIL
eukprot:6182413-Pleurochrysis_carterae.AAC.2